MRLAPNVRLASVDGDLVFLDAEKDRYSCVTRSDAAAISSLLAGAPHDIPEASAMAEELALAGLLEPGQPLGELFFRREEAPVADFHAIAAPALRSSATTWWHLIGAAAEAAVKTRSKPARWLKPTPRLPGTIPVTRACTLALQFDRLRPLVPWAGRCLPNSLLLKAFLRRHGVEAKLVLGVHTFPFEAHCWIEHEGVVLNDTLEHVSWYTPIAVA